MRNVLAHAGKQGRRVVAAFIATAFAQEDADMAGALLTAIGLLELITTWLEA